MYSWKHGLVKLLAVRRKFFPYQVGVSPRTESIVCFGLWMIGDSP